MVATLAYIELSDNLYTKLHAILVVEGSAQE